MIAQEADLGAQFYEFDNMGKTVEYLVNKGYIQATHSQYLNLLPVNKRFVEFCKQITKYYKKSWETVDVKEQFYLARCGVEFGYPTPVFEGLRRNT